MDRDPALTLRPGYNLHLDLSATRQVDDRGPPSVLISLSPTSPSHPHVPPPAVDRARGELRKLLAHLLSGLKSRPSAPTVYESVKAVRTGRDSYKLGAVVEKVKGAVRLKSSLERQGPDDIPDDDDDTGENDQRYSTDDTCDLMLQLRDVLILSANQGWQIFDAVDLNMSGSQREHSSQRRLRRHSPQREPRSRSPSPSGSFRAPGLLLECLDILVSVISEDCRFRMSSSRVFRPPYSLQSATLDVAQCLVNAHRHDARVLSRIGFAVIPAFQSFSPSLHSRLLAFFEDGIIRGMLDDLRSLQFPGMLARKDTNHEDLQITKTPVVAIQVVEAVDEPSTEGPGWLQWPSTSGSMMPSVFSAVAPSQALAVYHLSSLIPPLLGGVLECIDTSEDDIKDIPRFYRLCTLLRTIVSTKHDAYLDLLEVIAYYGPKTRRRALTVLATFWPKALGHPVIGKSLPIISIADSLSNQTPSLNLKYARPSRDPPYSHEFVPWRFSTREPSSGVHHGTTHRSCQSCYGVIAGFGLLCPFCLTAVHLNCYDAPNSTFRGQYLPVSETTHRQCFITFSNTLPPQQDMAPDSVAKAHHTFRMANLFTLSLCLVCRKPLWGCVKQGLKCSSCKQFVHFSCMSSPNSDTFPSCLDFTLAAHHVTIEWGVLRRTFVDHYKELLLDEEALLTKSYEEVSIFYSILWTQLCILDNGIAYKSIVPSQSNLQNILGKGDQVDRFELRHFVRLYETVLASGKLVMSRTLQEHYQANAHTPAANDNLILFDWPLLAYIASVIKTPLPSHSSALTPPNLLQVSDHEMERDSNTPSYPYELVTLTHMRKALGLELHINSERSVDYMLSHLNLVGISQGVDLDRLWGDSRPRESFCTFPLPLGLDLSTSVETLVVAIDACLQDIDITVNEYGFLLLVRRFWPTGTASEYALTRLTKMVISWFLAEDDRLVVIARNYIAVNHSIPGVRTAMDAQPWPAAFRPSKNNTRGGGEYILCRKQLFLRHALPWLTAVHDLDVSLYAACVYDSCVDMTDASDPQYTLESPDSSQTNRKSQAEAKNAWGDVMLRLIFKLAQFNVTLSSFTAVLTKWFHSVSPPGTPGESIAFKSLPRLFNNDDGEPSRRTSTITDPSLPSLASEPTKIDTWKAFSAVASDGLEGLERSISWLRVMAYSAVDVPVNTLKNVFGLTSNLRPSFRTMESLLESTMVFMWNKTFGGDGFDLVMMEVHSIWVDELLRMMHSGEVDLVQNFIRYSLVTCLLVYGCDRQSIISLGLIHQEEARNFPQRRRTGRASLVPSGLEIDERLISNLSRYVAEGSDSVCAIIAKFLNVLVSDSALLETHEIDQFILVNGDGLSRCAWKFYDLDSHDLSDIRTSILLRILVVDSQPFDALLHDCLDRKGEWRHRYHAASRLFRIVMDVTSPSFSVEGRQWKSNVTNIFNYFFKLLWVDDTEEIRSAVDTWAHTLLPGHLNVISSCWDEYMNKSPMSDRASLSAFLLQLCSHFPAWRLLSWSTIVEVLLEDHLLRNNEETDEGQPAAASPPGLSSSIAGTERKPRDDISDINALQVSLVLLSLQMIANGISIDLTYLLKIKFILGKILGFNSTFPTEGRRIFHLQLESLDNIRESSFPCISPLARVLDASHPLLLPPSSMGVTWNELPVTGLVGDAFVDIVGSLWELASNIQTLPYSVLRALLECVFLVIVKHDINSPALKHLEEVICKAVRKVTDLIASDSSYDLRHLCLSVMQVYMQGYPVAALQILWHQVLVLTQLASSLHFDARDSLVLNAKEFLGAAFNQYEVSGLFWLLSKQGRMSNDFFLMLRMVVNDANSVVSGEPLRDSIVRDTLSKVAANTNDRTIPDVLYNLEKYISMCYHQSFPASLIQHIGFRLTAIARQTVDLASSTFNRSAPSFDPNPLLLMSAAILQHNKAQSAQLLPHIETLLRTALVKFEVNLDTLNRLLRVVSTVYRRSASSESSGTMLPTNSISICVLEVLSESLKGKTRTLPSSMNAMFEAVISLHNNPAAFVQTSNIVQLIPDAVTFLTYPPYREAYGQSEFTVSLAAAKLVLYAAIYSPSILAYSFAGDTRNPPVRVWNLMVLATLKSADSDPSIKLFPLLPNFVLAYTSSLKRPLSGLLNDFVAPDVNHAFASVKLWMLLARRTSLATTNHVIDRDASERLVWNELWPFFERLSLLPFANHANGDMPPLLTFVWGCVSDLILFVRQAHSIVALDGASHVSLLNSLRASSYGESTGTKFDRALRSISETMPSIPFDTLVAQVSNDVLAAEKLQALETYKQSGGEKRKEYMDKRRVEARELRATT